MNTTAPINLLWPRIQYLLRQMGWPGALGAVLLIGAAWVQLIALPQLQMDSQRLQREKRALMAGLAQTQSTQSDVESVPPPIAERWQIDAALQTIYASAKQHGIRLAQGEYRLQAEAGTSYLRYHMTFPAQAGYVALRKWLQQVTLQQAGLSVELLELKRKDITSDQLEAQIGLVLLVKQS